MCSKNNYEYYKIHKICVRCGQEDAERNHTMCLECMMKSREYSLKYARKHKKERQEKNRIRSKERYYRLKEQGICTCCGRRITKNNKVLCNHCSARINYRKRQEYLLNIYATKNMCEIRI